MRRFRAFFAGMAVAALVMGGAAGPASSQGKNILNQVISSGTLRIAIDGSPPRMFFRPDGTPDGYEIDMAKQLAEALKVKPQFVTVDPAGRVTVLQTGKADVTIAGFSRTVERAQTIAFTQPYMVTSIKVMVLAKRTELKAEADLNDPKFTVGVTRGGTSATNVPLILPKATLAYFGISDGVSALRAGQVDAMSFDNFVVGDLISKSPGEFKMLEESGGIRLRGELAIGLPAGDYDWWRVVNLWVEQFNASGRNAALFKERFGYDLPPVKADH